MKKKDIIYKFLTLGIIVFLITQILFYFNILLMDELTLDELSPLTIIIFLISDILKGICCPFSYVYLMLMKIGKYPLPIKFAQSPMYMHFLINAWGYFVVTLIVIVVKIIERIDEVGNSKQ